MLLPRFAGLLAGTLGATVCIRLAVLAACSSRVSRSSISEARADAWAAAWLEICRGLTAQFGPRFHAPALLREMAEKGETFYGRFAGEKAAA